MKKATKGALAAAAAGSLMLGGAGSLAYWTDQGTVDGGDVTSGHLKLVATDTTACAGWKLDATPTPTAYVPGTNNVVPGDTLRQSCSYTVDMVGDRLSAELSVSDLTGTWSGDAALQDEMTKSVVFKKNGTTITTSPVTIADNDVITAALTVAFPFAGATNASNDINGFTAHLDDITVTATQVATP